MGEFNRKVRFRGVMRLAAVGATAAVLAGCSSDASRLGAGPFSRADFTPTASIGSQTAPLTPPGALGGQAAFPQQGQVQTAAPAVASVVESAPLAPPSMPTRPNFQQVPQQAAQQVRPVAQSAAATRAASSFGPWTAAGGANVVVGPQESASVVAARYGVPMDALLRVNGLTSAAQVVPGSRLTIPVFDANSRQTAAAPAPQQAARAAPQQTKQSSQRQSASRPVAPATTQNAAPAARQAAATQATPVRRPTEAAPTRTTETRKPEQARPAVAARGAAARSEAAGRDGERQKTAQAAAASTQKPAAETRVERQPAPVAEAAKPEFRWPARGRIIQGFRRGANDGIAISVPEGTPVKAAESGVVAYAGSELKGYGNLVLIRHPNGFVSAYAHNGELKVKRGETVRRGQTIARSGQTGNVSTPQLHFELRKGSTPVDPTSYLASL